MDADGMRSSRQPRTAGSMFNFKFSKGGLMTAPDTEPRPYAGLYARRSRIQAEYLTRSARGSRRSVMRCDGQQNAPPTGRAPRAAHSRPC